MSEVNVKNDVWSNHNTSYLNEKYKKCKEIIEQHGIDLDNDITVIDDVLTFYVHTTGSVTFTDIVNEMSKVCNVSVECEESDSGGILWTVHLSLMKHKQTRWICFRILFSVYFWMLVVLCVSGYMYYTEETMNDVVERLNQYINKTIDDLK